jgi:AcrR family transcriptional regulator
MAEGPGRGSRKNRRAEILDHAAKLFHAQGYHATTMDDLAESLKLNKGTLYYYYESKANVLFEILLNTSEQRLAMMRAQSADMSSEDAVRHFVEDTISYLAQHPVEAAVSFQEAPFLSQWLSKDQVRVIQKRHRDFEKHAVDAVTKGQAGHVFDPDLDPRVAAQALTGIVSWFVRWYRPNSRLSAKEIARQSSSLALRGLLVREAADPRMQVSRIASAGHA